MVRFNFTINNLLDDEHLRANGLTGGVWDNPRTFRLSMRTDL